MTCQTFAVSLCALLLTGMAAVPAASPAVEPCCVCSPNQRAVDGFRRAGHPQAISPLAKPSITHHYTGGYIGGGAPFHFGAARADHQGTWGVDYSGVVFHRRVWLNWWHGRQAQGGTGAYKTDGPHLELHK